MKTYDFVVVGGGIVGLTVARHLRKLGLGRIAIFEKERELGCHSSGRNSGVLHSGIYYSSDSIKAKVCSSGALRMQEYAAERGIPVRKSGKLIVAPTERQVSQIDALYQRARANGIRIEKIDAKRIREIEPESTASYGCALYSPDTGVIDTKAVLYALEKELLSDGVDIIKAEEVMGVDAIGKALRTRSSEYGYGHLVNAAGLHADRVAHWMGVGKKYRIVPFKGVYRKLSPEMSAKFRGSIYPTPDLRIPFLGVHVTRTINDEVIVGPTAIPAFGRENYGVVSGWSPIESPVIGLSLLTMLARDSGGFRTLVWEEFGKYFFSNFLKAARCLAPGLKPEHFIASRKVGLRAQLVDTEKMTLEMDFVVEHGPSSTHILNAVSPAFTASFAFAEWVGEWITDPGFKRSGLSPK